MDLAKKNIFIESPYIWDKSSLINLAYNIKGKSFKWRRIISKSLKHPTTGLLHRDPITIGINFLAKFNLFLRF